LPSTYSLKDLKELYGELKDGEESQEKFRAFISQEKWKLDDYKRWLDEAVQEKLSKEFQDIVTVLGERLGFKKKFGYYSSVKDDISYDGLWENDDLRIVIEAKLGAWIRNDVNQLGKYLDKMSSEKKDNKKTYGMYVVGSTDEDQLRSFSEQIRGSDYTKKIRLISYVDLLKLVDIKEKNDLSNDQVSKILIPFDDVNVGKLVEIINIIMEEKGVASVTPPLSGGDGERPPSIEVPVVSRASLSHLEKGDVVVCPSKPSGTDFLRRYQAWPARIGSERKPRYFALYISSPVRAIKYFAEVEDVVEADGFQVENPEDKKYLAGKRMIQLKKGSIRELSDPIKRGTQYVPQGIWYTSLSKFLHAKTLDDL